MAFLARLQAISQAFIDIVTNAPLAQTAIGDFDTFLNALP